MGSGGPVSAVHSIIVLALILTGLALLMANIVPQEGTSIDVGEPLSLLSGTLSQIMLSIGLLLMIWVIVRSLRNRQRAGLGRGRVTEFDIVPTLVLLVVIFMVMVALPGLLTDPSWLGDGGGGEGDGSSGSGESMDGGRGMELLLPTFVLLTAGTVLALFFIYMRDREPPAISWREEGPEGGREKETVSLSLEEIVVHKDVREAILSVYRRMVRLHSSEVEVRNMTAQELSDRLIGGWGWPLLPTARLTHLFEEARYSHHSMGEEHRNVALESLDHIERWLTGRREGV